MDDFKKMYGFQNKIQGVLSKVKATNQNDLFDQLLAYWWVSENWIISEKQKIYFPKQDAKYDAGRGILYQNLNVLLDQL